MQQCDELGKEFRDSYSSPTYPKDRDLDHNANVFHNFAAKARLINVSSCPSDFAEAFYRMIAATDNCGSTLASHPHIPEDATEGFISGAIKGLQGDYSGGANDIKEWDNRCTQKADAMNEAEQELKAGCGGYGG